MAVHLIIADHDTQKLKKTTLSVLTASKKIEGKRIGLVVGSKTGKIVEEFSLYVDEVLFIEDDNLAFNLPEPISQIVEHLITEYKITHVWAAATVFAKDFMPKVAAKTNSSMISEIEEVIDEKTMKRSMWAGDIIGTVELLTDVKIITVRCSEFEESKEDKKGIINSFKLDNLTSKVKFVKLDEIKLDRPSLSEASTIVSGGRGLKSAQNFKKLIEPLADELNAGIGATRAICDAGWVPNDWQVGQTGKIVAPDLYMAIGISGAIQHVAGMKSSKIIVAINTDIEAPIFQVADYGLVMDASEAIPELISLIKEEKSKI